MTKAIKIIDQPLPVREAYFAGKLNELIKETGITLGIATKDNLPTLSTLPTPRVSNKVTQPAQQKTKKSKK